MSAYVVYGHHNDSYAFRAVAIGSRNLAVPEWLVPNDVAPSREGTFRCQTCGELLDKWDFALKGLVIRKRKYDVSATYDGVTVASQRFKDAYDQSALSGLVVRPLPDDPAFFAITASRVVEFDAARRRTRFEGRCQSCGQFKAVAGASPVYLKEGSQVADDEFVRTDIEFGSGDENHPLLICGEGAARVLSAARLKGLEMEAIAGQ